MYQNNAWFCFQRDYFLYLSTLDGQCCLWYMLLAFYLTFHQLVLLEWPSLTYLLVTSFQLKNKLIKKIVKILGCAVFLIVQLLGTPGFDLEHVGNILHWIFLMVPHYSLASGIFDTFKLYSYNSLCNTYYETCRQRYPNYTKEQCWDLSSSVKSVCEGE